LMEIGIYRICRRYGTEMKSNDFTNVEKSLLKITISCFIWTREYEYVILKYLGIQNYYFKGKMH
jgi:hypothetical protein